MSDKPPDLMIARDQLSLREMVVDRMRDSILFGSLRPGQKLIERDLCNSLGVSRTVLREALQRLQGEGLIINVLHKGPSVAIISEQDARDIYEIRELLEARAGRGFALGASEDQINALADTVDRLRDPSTGKDARSLLLAKNAFYETLLDGCGNQVIADMLTQLNNRTTILRRMSLSHPGRLVETISELDAIVEKIRERKPDEVASLCAAHVARAGEIALGGFGAEETLVSVSVTA